MNIQYEPWAESHAPQSFHRTDPTGRWSPIHEIPEPKYMAWLGNMNQLYAQIDAHAERAKQELHEMTQQAIDRIKVKCGWFIRSDAQKLRYRNAKLKGEAK